MGWYIGEYPTQSNCNTSQPFVAIRDHLSCLERSSFKSTISYLWSTPGVLWQPSFHELPVPGATSQVSSQLGPWPKCLLRPGSIGDGFGLLPWPELPPGCLRSPGRWRREFPTLGSPKAVPCPLPGQRLLPHPLTRLTTGLHPPIPSC